jgi:hypothetical protein
LDAKLAAGAVLDVDLQCVPVSGRPTASSGADWNPRVRPPVGTGRSTWSGSRCAGKRSCSCRTGCKGLSPRPRRAPRCCASRAAVPLGYVPSTGSALTGRSSPRPASISAVTVRTNSGACAGTTGGSPRTAVACAGTSTSVQTFQCTVDRRLVSLDHLGAAPAVGLDDGCLDPVDRLLRGNTPPRRRSRSAG